MSTIGSLMLALGQGGPKPYGDILEQTTRTRGGELGNQTALLTLADLKERQRAEQEYLLAIQNDPELAKLVLGGGGSVLGSPALLQQPPGAPSAPGPLTQSPLGGGAAQQIPAYPDASRFANVPPQGTPMLATIGPQGGMPGPQQGPMPAPRNPALEMAQRDPRVALMMQQQIQAQQDRQWQMQEKGLSNRIKVVDYLARMAQGATDQDSWKQFIEEADRVQPGAGARLPQMYSKEARDRVVAQGFEVKDALGLQIEEGKAATAGRRLQFDERQAAAGVPKYTEDSTLNVAIDRRMQQAGIPRGTPPPEAILTQAQQDVETAKVRVSASQGTGQIVKGPTGEYVRVRPGTDEVEVIKGPGGEPLREKPSETEQKGATLANSVAAANTLATELEDKGYKPSVWEKGLDKLPLGLGNYVTSSDYQKYRQTVREFASAWLYGVSGAQITDSEWENANQTFFPQPNEDKGAVELKRQRRAALVEQLRQQTQATGRTGTQRQPTSQGSTGTGGQPGGKVVTRAALQAENARRNEANRAAGRPELSNEQAEAMAKQKGYTVQ